MDEPTSDPNADQLATFIQPAPRPTLPAAPIAGREVVLRPVMPADYELIRLRELSPELIWRWRSRGSTPSPEDWAQSRARSVLAEFLVIRRRSGQPLGIVFAYNANLAHGFAYVAVGSFDPSRPSPLFLSGAVLFVNYLFRTWPLRKLYAEVTQYNYERFRSESGRIFRLEGCLRQHFFLDGRYWDEYLLAIYREDWETRASSFLKHAL
jgi:hypothetical protein